MEGKLKEIENQESLLNMNKLKLEENEEREEENVPEEKSGEESLLDLSPENLELAQQILAIDLILVKILENLPTKSLVNFRLVNKTWEKEATKIIMKGFKTHLALEFDWNSEVAKIKDRNLSELNECIRKSRGFPCSYVEICGIPLNNSDLVEFCTLHGSEIRRLDLELYEQKATSMGNFLLVQVPNVQELKIVGEDEIENSPTRLFPKNSVLPHLKSFTYESFPLASEIIQVSPNLKRVLIRCIDSSLNAVETLASMRKIPLLKKINVEHNYENLILFEKLADGNPKIEKLGLYSSLVRPRTNEFLQRRFVNAVSKILESSKETLTHVNLFLHHELLMGFKWPRLEKVCKLTLRSGFHGNIDVPLNFISRVFPNTRIIKNYGEPGPHCFSSQVPLTHLTECKLFLVLGWNLQNLASFAPHLTKLVLTGINNFPGIAGSLWSCSGLKQLEIELAAATNLFPQLDMAFTGLEEEMVRNLYADPDYFNEMKIPGNKKEISRPNPSILNCPDLTCLKIGIGCSRIQIQSPPVMTSVSGEFGFKMHENLHVEIEASADILTSLDALKPYARVSQFSEF